MGGLCIAYSSTQPITIILQSEKSEMVVLPASDTIRVERIPWSSFVPMEYGLLGDLSVSDGETEGISMSGISFEMSITDSLQFNIVSVGGYNGDCGN